jgi:hypothetical protein
MVYRDVHVGLPVALRVVSGSVRDTAGIV